MNIEIKHRYNASILFAHNCENNSLAITLAMALKARADLSGANLSGANLRSAKNSALAVAQTRILPEGDLIGWKKCLDGIIVKLRVPEASKRCHAFGRKCRAEYVEVVEMYTSDGVGDNTLTGVSRHDRKTTYNVGQRVTCDVWGEDYTVECSGGIHFFITRIEAENY